MLKGKKLSILGDSISTYEGVSNNDYCNNTVDRLHPDEDGMRLIADTVESAMRSRDRQENPI